MARNASTADRAEPLTLMIFDTVILLARLRQRIGRDEAARSRAAGVRSLIGLTFAGLNRLR
jgi:hypothetical protein